MIILKTLYFNENIYISYTLNKLHVDFNLLLH